MVRRALKEWDAVCRAIAYGQVSVLLRKSGILDPGGPIEAGEEPFALFPTFEHQRAERLRSDLVPLLRPDPAGGRFAEISLVAEAALERLVLEAEALDPIAHLAPLSRDHVLDRVAYGRTRGVRAILVRARRLAAPVRVAITAEIAGCVSWVPLAGAIEADPAVPVLDDAAFDRAREAFVAAFR